MSQAENQLPINLAVDQINQDLLPPMLQEIAELIGLEPALLLVKAYGGVPLYVPAKACESHPIANLIGMTPFTRLVSVYQQDTVCLPKFDAAERQIKHQLLRQMKQTHSNRDIALRLNYTQRHVERLVREHREEQQIDLFKE